LSGRLDLRGEHEIPVSHFGVTTHALLHEGGVFSVRLLAVSQPSREAPASGGGIFFRILDHKLGTNEFARNDRGGEGIAVFLLPVQFGQNGSLGPGIGFALPGRVDGDAIAQDGAQGLTFRALGYSDQAPVLVAVRDGDAVG
jgi:hypothetical protein